MVNKRVPVCECGGVISLEAKYDAYYCWGCHSWKESICDEHDCSFCAGRPKDLGVG